MAGDYQSERRVEPVLDGGGLRVGVVCARFNDGVTWRLLDGVRRGLDANGVASGDVEVVWVPGSFELPVTAKALATSGRFDAVICLGSVIRGDTSHYELVAGECARGIQSVALETGLPILFGVLTTENVEQALVRSEDAGGHNVGEEAAAAAVEMVAVLRAAQPRSEG
jgi:6,7-dimethyl-8-ribityllumazine synthase